MRRFLHASPSRAATSPTSSSSAPIRPEIADVDTFAGVKAYQMPAIHSTLKPSFLRPTLFAAAVAAGAYVWAAYATNEDTARQEKAFQSRSNSFFAREPTDVDLANTRRTELLQDAKQFLIRHLGNPPDSKSTKTRLLTLVTEWWINKNEAQRTALGLIGVQAVIFAAWRVAPRFMAASFTHYPLSGRSYTLLTSVFSHQSGLHFVFNSIAFYSFAPGAFNYLWHKYRDSSPDLHEASPKYHYIAMFVATGVIASLASHVYTLAFKLPKALATRAGKHAILPSLGASGAIYATVVVTALAYPAASVNLIFLPFFSFPIGYGVGGMVLTDALGLIFGWRFFDHAAHLAGAFSGLVVYIFSPTMFDWLRKLVSSTSAQQQPTQKRISIK